MRQRARLERAHPFTLFAVTGGVALLAFLLPAPVGPLLLYGVVALAALSAGAGRPVVRAMAVCLPLWVLLLLFQDRAVALAQGARLGAVATASLTLFMSFDSGRFLDAVSARGWSFHAAYLLISTLQAAPRMRRRAAAIIEAQRARGLRYRGNPVRRLRALAPLTLPLALGMLSEVDERAIALEMRGLDAGVSRTALDPPQDRLMDRVARWGTGAAVVAAIIWRIAR